MTLADEPRDVRNCRFYSSSVSVVAVLAGSIVLLGWALGVKTLTSVIPGLATMKPNTALGFMATGLALWLLQLRLGELSSPRIRQVYIARSISAGVALLGLLTLVEYLFHLDIGVDDLLFRNSLLASGIVHPGRMAGATALGFLLVGAGLGFCGSSKSYLCESFALLATLNGFVASVGYLLSARALYDIPAYSSMALHTAILFFLLGLATLAARPQTGLMVVVTSPYLGGVMVRRILPIIVFTVALLGWLRWRGQLAGFYGTEFGIAILILGEITIFVTLLWRSARQLNRLDRQNRESEQQNFRLAAIVESSDNAILSKDLSGTVTSWNRGAERLYGYTAAEIVGKPVTAIIPLELQPQATQFLKGIEEGKLVTREETMRRRKDGTLVNVALSMSPVRDMEGRIVGASTIAYDISDRKRAVDSLRESEARMRLFVEHAPASLAMFDREMRYLHVSRRWRTDFGLGDRDLRGVSNYDIFPDLPERWKKAHQRGLAGEVLRADNDRFDRADGSVQWMRWEVRPWYDGIGGIGGVVIFTEDVTHRHESEAALANSRQALEDKTLLLQSVLDSMSEGLVVADEHGRFVIWNPAAQRIVGLGPMNMPSSDWTEHYKLYLPDKVTPFPSEFNPLARAILGDAGSAVMFLRHPQVAEGRFIEANASPLKDKHGVLRGGVTAFRDITERIEAEEKLREYERVVEGLEEMIVVVDRQYRYVIANKAFLAFRGMSAEQVVGHFADEVVGKEVFENLVKERMDECFRGKAVQYELTYAFPDLGKRDLFASYFPIVGPVGVERIACVLQDITDRKRGEEALRKSEERFSKAFRNSPLGIVIATETDGKYLDVNDAFLSMLGHERRDVIGHTSADIRFWAEPSDRDEMLRQLKQDERIAKLDVRFKTKAGEGREAELWAESIELDGQRCVLGIVRDITEVRQLEMQFRQAQKMEAVGRLAGGVAHDFNNMLGVILGYSDISLGLGVTGPIERYLSEIKKASQRAAILTRQLLAFSRQQVVFPKILNLNDVVRDVTSMFLRLVGEDIEVEFHPAASLGGIKADAGQIEQILMNLVVNARDAMPNGGKIIIETQNAELDEYYAAQHPGARAGGYVVLAVSDTGCGMDEKTKSQIFEPFFTTKAVGHGTGLGLSTVYGIVKQSEGYIIVYSEVGKGTTLKIYFPQVSERATAVVAPMDTEPPKGSETILVVEDDQTLRKLILKLLQEGEYRVLEADDAESALQTTETYEGEIHLLLTDVVMPGKSGVELLTQARLRYPNLRWLFMSGYAGDLVALRGAAIKETSFLEKPFTKNSLLKKVHAALHADATTD